MSIKIFKRLISALIQVLRRGGCVSTSLKHKFKEDLELYPDLIKEKDVPGNHVESVQEIIRAMHFLELRKIDYSMKNSKWIFQYKDGSQVELLDPFVDTIDGYSVQGTSISCDPTMIKRFISMLSFKTKTFLWKIIDMHGAKFIDGNTIRKVPYLESTKNTDCFSFLAQSCLNNSAKPTAPPINS